jgi:hypothetical protein
MRERDADDPNLWPAKYEVEIDGRVQTFVTWVEAARAAESKPGARVTAVYPDRRHRDLTMEARAKDALKVEKPAYLCPTCGRPTYFKSADGWRPFCSEQCAIKATTPHKAKDALQPIPELGDFPLAAEPLRGEAKDAFAKRPGAFIKGERVVVDGTRPGTVQHEFGGEDVGWVRVKLDDDTVVEVNVSRLKKAQAKDSLFDHPLLALGALLAILVHFAKPKETVGPQDYDLRTYKPKKREW